MEQKVDHAVEHNVNELSWLIESGLQNANFWETLFDGKVRCHLCPRNCMIKSGNLGFCKSRFNNDGILQTAIWGKLLTPSIEPIETEAVFHYMPGEKILSIGNLGCNLECDFCQNWESSNLENLSPKFVKNYSPEDVIELAKALGIKIVSFTYNDPAIWFEFVYKTSKLAKENGLKTLFKSAGYLSAQAAKKLTEVIDVFSISLKSINPKTFTKMSKGTLGPVLEAIKIFHKCDSHLEISNLIVTGMTDVEEEVRELSQWVKNELSADVPVHFVRFHPAYKYNDVERTPIKFLEKAHEIATEVGLKYVYIGNTYQDNHADVSCKKCGNLLVSRFGLYTKIEGLTDGCTCTSCGEAQNLVIGPENVAKVLKEDLPAKGGEMWQWTNLDARNLHVEVKNTSSEKGLLVCEHLGENGDVISHEILSIPGNEEVRIAVGQSTKAEKEVRILYSNSVECNIAELLDRAHFPLEEICQKKCTN